MPVATNKYEFYITKIEFYGFIIIKPKKFNIDPKKIKAIIDQ